ncbi:formylglycine-generating enzyme family protein [Novosphingobium sp. SL115]|uniref:formylglycine-generating enzyme family protein n=1 Tax=Novosphingobium sp. SL115 TaxID=2995150 RepID=UPI0022732BB2|nr:formylglycine-generating enzyme family protein [Novosphingobium sp. SL115]MCY1672218.1 formylglycine-generating enzyme family protein [Novosphingobium sp. SL115]
MTARSARLCLTLAMLPVPALAQETAFHAGSAFADGPDYPEMVVVPPGDFIMGSSQEERDALGVVPLFDTMESPRHMVTIGYRFAISRYEVTFDQWDACVADGGCGGYRPADEGWGRGRRPVIHVHYGDAVSYVEWLSRKTGQRYRLPSEAEWEYGARAGTSTWFLYGDKADSAKANFGNTIGRTLPVGSYAPNAFGLHDMTGNVAEWTADCHHNGFAGAPVDGSAWDAALPCKERNVRGSGWSLSDWTTRAAQRINDPVKQRNSHLGLRVVRELPQPQPRPR